MTERDRRDATALGEGWQELIRAKARAQGWNIDVTHDLPRVLRPPGTFFNYRLGTSDTGHFALEEDGQVIADHIRRFLSTNVKRGLQGWD